MALRDKTKRRLKWSAVAVLALGCAAGGAYGFRVRQLEQRAVAKRAEGVKQLEAGDYYNALHNFGSYVQRHPTDADAIFQYATARKNVEEPNGKHLFDAIRFYRRVLDLTPEHAEAAAALLQLYAATGYDTEAMSLAESVLLKRPDDATALTTKAMSLTRLRRFDDALKVALVHAQARPTELDAHLLVLSLMQKCNRPATDLITYAEELRKKSPQSPIFALLQSFAFAVADDKPQATTWARTAAASAPQDATLVLAISRQLDGLGLFGESLEFVRNSVQANSDVRLKRILAARLIGAKGYDAVLTLLQPTWHGGDPELQTARVISLVRSGKQNDAAAEAASLKRPDDQPSVAAWSDVANVVLKADDLDARARIRTLSAAQKHHPENAYIYFLLADAHADASEHEAALQNWQRAFAAAPAWSEPLDRRARLLVRLGRIEEAVANATAAHERAPEDTEPKVGLALALAAAARAGQANRTPELLKLVDEIQAERPGEEFTLPLQIALLAQSGGQAKAGESLRAVLAAELAPSEQALLQLAAVSRQFKLGLEDACIDRSEKAHGLTPSLALTKAQQLHERGQAADALALLDAAQKEHRVGKESEWGIVWARYLDQSKDGRAHDEWVQLADRFPEETNLQWLAIASPSMLNDHAFVGRILERLKGQVGETTLTWRLARAQWLLGGKSTNKDAVEAALILNEVSRGSPDLLAPRLLLAASFEKLGNTTGAIEQLSVAANLQPGSNEIALELARLLQSRGDYVQARAHIDRVIQNHTATPVQRRTTASLLAQHGDTDAALKLLEADLNPADLPANRTLAMIFRKRNEPAKVEAILKKLLVAPDAGTLSFAADFYAAQNRRADADAVLARLDSLSVDAAEKHIARAEFYRRHGPQDRVSPEYEAATKVSPENAMPWRQLAIYQMATNRPAEAAATISSAASVLPGNPTFEAAKKHLASFASTKETPAIAPLLVWLLENATDEPAIAEVLPAVTKALTKDASAASAATALRPLADRYPRLVPLQTMVAERYLTAGRPDDAVTIASRAMQASPNAPIPARLVSTGLFAQRKWTEALAAAEQWRQRSGDHPLEADQMIAYVRLQMSDPVAAKAQLATYMKEALIDPDQFRPLILQYAQAEIASGNATAAAELLRPMLKRSPEWRLGWMQMIVQAQQDTTLAATWLTEIEPTIPQENFPEQLALAETWQAVAQRSKSKEHLAAAKAITARIGNDAQAQANASALLSLGVMYEMQDNAEAAEVAYRDALKVDPELRIAQNNLAMLLTKQGRASDEALALATRATQGSHPNLTSFLDTLATVQAKRKEYDEAIRSIGLAVKAEPTNLVWQIRQAGLLAESGNTDRAKAALQGIDALNPRAEQMSEEAWGRLQSLRSQLTQASPQHG